MVQEPRNINAYLWVMRRNEAINEWRAKTRRGCREISLSNLPMSFTSKVATVDTYCAQQIVVMGIPITVQDEDIYAALYQLRPVRRDILLMYYFLGMSDREIGEQLHLPQGTVQYRRTRALKQMQEILK